MTDSDAIRERAEVAIIPTYNRFGPVLVRGEGCILWDADGRKYLDFVAGIAVCGLGHAHPELSAVLREQAERLWHVSNLYYTLPQVELAEALTSRCFADRVFFCNSGAEANEAAIKLARRYSLSRHAGGSRFHIICMENSFHGRTLATVSATGQQKVRQGFGPLLLGFSFVPFGDVAALRGAVTEDTCAVMLEPIQGNGGVRVPPPGYLRAVRELCDERGMLLIFDEVQVGMGRAGHLFCHQAEGVDPDVMTLAKALANGLPIGAMLATEEAALLGLPAGSHASTFGGTPLVSAVARRTLELLAAPEMLAHVREMGDYLLSGLRRLQGAHPRLVKEARGRGLIRGLELAEPLARRLMELALAEGLLIDVATDRVIRLVPPLVVGRPEIDALCAGLDRALPILQKDADK
ncbi:MAG: aspartate aminotransferase family protein [Pseudomonadota bacterium]